MAIIRFGDGDSDILISTAGDSYLGEGGDDTYIIDPAFVQAGDQISIVDGEGANLIRLVGGLEITGSQVANNALQLTLSNGTVIFVDGAAAFSFDIGTDISGASGITTDFAGMAAALGTTVPTGAGANAGTNTGLVNDDGTIGTGGGDATPLDLDALGGTQIAAAEADVSSGAFALTDDIGAQNFVDVTGFGADDTLTFTGGATEGDIRIDPGSDTLLTVNNDGLISQITLLGVETGLSVQTVADFNALDGVGDILIG